MRALITVTLATLALAAAPTLASAADVYVETGGSDTPGCGTTNVPASSACATIAYATGVASSGDRVLIGPGTFTQSAAINPGAKSIEYVGSGQSGVNMTTVRSNGTNFSGIFAFRTDGITTAVRDLRLTDFPGTGISRFAIWVQPGSATPANFYAVNTTVSDVTFDGVPNPGTEYYENAVYAANNNGTLTISDSTVNNAMGNSILLENHRGAVNISGTTINKNMTALWGVYNASIRDWLHRIGGAWDQTAPHVFSGNTINAAAPIQVVTGGGAVPGNVGSAFTQGVTIEDNTLNTLTSPSSAISVTNQTTIQSDGEISNIVVDGNDITTATGAGTGVSIQGLIDGVQIEHNNIRNRSNGVSLSRWLTGIVPLNVAVNGNQLVDNTTGVRTETGQTISANLDGNWWGCNEGPAIDDAPPAGDCDTVTTPDANAGNITLNNWIVLRIAATPASTLAYQGAASVSAGFDQLNTNAPAPSDAFEDGTVMPLTGTMGNFANPNPTTSSGLATTTFTSYWRTGRSASSAYDHESVTHNWPTDTDPLTLHVETPGNGGVDSSTCGPLPHAPCATIQQAYANSLSGDTIEVGPGTFPQTTCVSITRNLTITGAGKGVTILDGQGATGMACDGMLRPSGDGQQISISDMTFTNLAKGPSASTAFAIFAVPTTAYNTVDVTVTDVEVIGTGTASGVSPSGFSSSNNLGAVIVDNFTWPVGSGNSIMLQNHAGSAIVEDSTITQSSTSIAIFDYSWGGGAKTVTGNHIYRRNTLNAANGIYVNAGFSFATNLDPSSYLGDVIFEDNTFNSTASSAFGIRVANTPRSTGPTPPPTSSATIDNVKIHGNTFVGAGAGSGISLQGKVDEAEIERNSMRGYARGLDLARSPASGFDGDFPSDATASANQIVDNTTGVRLEAPGYNIPADLSGNWWGCNEGPEISATPAAADCDSVTSSSNALTLANWVVLRITASPVAELSYNGSAAVTTGFDQLNTNAAAPSGTFADGTPVPMTSTAGSLASPTVTLTSQLASNTFTAAGSIGRSASSSFDHETVTHNWNDDVTPPVIEITAPANGLITNQSSVQVNYTIDDFGGGATCNIADGATVPLTPGANTIVVTCFDAAGNFGYDSVAVIYDNVDPTVSIISPDDGLITSAASVIVNFTANDAYGIDSCDKTDGFSAPLVEGPNTISVSCTDEAGNTGSDSITVTRDTIPPAVTITSPADGLITNVQTHTLAYSFVDATATNCTPANGSTVTLSPGSNSVTVTCTDEAGNVGSATNTVIYDTTAPTVDITSPNDGLLTNQNSVSVSYTSSDANGIASCTPPSSPFTANLVEGDNTITVTCTDNAGNIGSDSITVTRNTTPPTVDITSPNDGLLTNQSSVSVSYTSSDDVGIAGCTPPSSPFTANLVEGDNTITVTCTDNAGNIGSDSITVTRNTTPPTVDITAPNDGLVTQAGSVQVSYTASDDVGIDSCTPATSPFTATLSEGPNTISVSCTDNAGNTGDDQITVTRDTIAPDVEITDPDNGLITNASSVDVEFEVDDATATTCNRNDGDAFALSAGVNTITVICTDAAGNIGFDSISVIRDNTAPTVTIVSPTDGLETNASSVIVNFTVLDAYGIDSCTKTDGFTATLTEGANVITVECTDNAGNTGNASITVTKDSTAPQVTISSPADGSSTTAADATLSYSVTDAHPTNCTPADGSQVSLNYGANVITVTCTDSFGNSGSAQTTVTRTSSEPPVVTITSPANGAIINAAQTTLTYNAASAHGTVSCTPASGASVPLAIGANELTVSCTDSFGNTTSASVTVFRPDTLPACAKDVTITEVTRVGSRTRIRGVARLQFAGQKVKLQYKPTGSKTAGTATVRVDGSFTAVVSRPANPSYKSDNARYRALLGSTSTAWIKITRRMGASAVTYDGNGRLVISGSVSKPLIRGQRLRVQRSDACGAYRQIGTLTIKSNGTFKGSVASGGGSQGAAFIRLAATVGNSGNPKRRTNTYSIVQPVVIER